MSIKAVEKFLKPSILCLITKMVSKLQSLPVFVAASVFIALSYGYELDCSFYEGDNGPSLGERLAAYCAINYEDNDFVNLVSVNGELENRTVADVEILYAYGYGSGAEAVDRLPTNLSKLFPNLVSLMWISKLRHVTKYDFEHWPNLIQLQLYSNMIRYLPGNLLASNPNLEWIEFSGNSISVIGAGFFNGLNALTQIGMTGNPCTNNPMFYPLSDLELLKTDIEFFCEALPSG